MPIAIVIGCAPVVVFTGPQKLAVDQDELGVAGALAGAADPDGEGGDRRSRGAGDGGDRDRGADRHEPARARGAVRREQRLCRARGLQHADAGDGDHHEAHAGIQLDHQPGDAERIQRHQEGRLRAAVPRASAGPSRRAGRPPRGDARAADQSSPGDLRAVRATARRAPRCGAACTAPPPCSRIAARSSSR